MQHLSINYATLNNFPAIDGDRSAEVSLCHLQDIVMPVTEFEAGKRWGEETIREIELDLEISLDLQWGPFWPDLTKRQRAKATNSLQLILSRGRFRKIVWLDANDLTSAISERPERRAARERIRSRVSQAIAAIAEGSSSV
jgi:hypothetical protein